LRFVSIQIQCQAPGRLQIENRKNCRMFYKRISYHLVVSFPTGTLKVGDTIAFLFSQVVIVSFVQFSIAVQITFLKVRKFWKLIKYTTFSKRRNCFSEFLIRSQTMEDNITFFKEDNIEPTF
jgi:hypothetical protein